MSFFYWLARAIVWLPIRLLYPTRFIGQKKFVKKGSIFAMNHLSIMDSLILGLHVRPQLHFIAKSELWRRKLIGVFLRWLGTVSVKRGQPDMNATKKALHILEKNKILAIFPEGTRNKSKTTNMQALKHGTALIALKAQVPIRTFCIWRKARIFRRNFIYVGEEFTLEQFYDKKITKEVLQDATAYISQKFEEEREKFDVFLQSKGRKLKEQIAQ